MLRRISIPTVLAIGTAAALSFATVPGKAAPAGGANAALRYWMAMAELNDLPGDSNLSATLDEVAEGRLPWNEQALGPLVTVNREALRTLVRGTALADCDWGLDWHLGAETPVAHLPRARVLGRLAALAAARSASMGDHAAALQLWEAGTTFSEHVAREGSLVSVLTARAILAAQLRTVRQVMAGEGLAPDVASRLRARFAELPVGALPWGAAMEKDANGVRQLVQTLNDSSDVERTYERVAGAPWPTGATVPSQTELERYSTIMAELASALSDSPQHGPEWARRLDAKVATLHPLLREWVPAVPRLLEGRATLESDRTAAIAALVDAKL
jgi:hypothetical protein